MDFPSERFREHAEASTGLVFTRAYNQREAIIKRELRKIGLTHPQFVVMTVVNWLSQRTDDVTQTSIAKMAEMDVMSVSQICRGLEKKSFLSRKPHPRDTRANVVTLLDKGQKAVAQALPLIEQIDDDFFGKLSTQEKEFREALHQLIDSSENEDN